MLDRVPRYGAGAVRRVYRCIQWQHLLGRLETEGVFLLKKDGDGGNIIMIYL